jgi:hypothetical protein
MQTLTLWLHPPPVQSMMCIGFRPKEPFEFLLVRALPDQPPIPQIHCIYILHWFVGVWVGVGQARWEDLQKPCANTGWRVGLMDHVDARANVWLRVERQDRYWSLTLPCVL